MTEFLFLHNAQVHIYLNDGVGGSSVLKLTKVKPPAKKAK